MRSITAKLGTMRKAVEWTVYPASKLVPEARSIVIQCDTRIAQFDIATGAGLLSAAKSGGAYFHHLSRFMGATDIVVPAEVIQAAIAAQPKSGDAIGPGVVIG